jgi:hypothetical protein
VLKGRKGLPDTIWECWRCWIGVVGFFREDGIPLIELQRFDVAERHGMAGDGGLERPCSEQGMKVHCTVREEKPEGGEAQEGSERYAV